MPAPEWIAATVPKRGNRSEENEDATAVSPDALRFAVSDGATEGWESGPWAARLAAAFIERPPDPAGFAGWLDTARDWTPPAADGPQPWYVAEKREQGSFATLIGLDLRVRGAGGWAWRAVAIGDSCLVHVRGATVALTFPLESAAAFGSRPPLVPSAAACPCPEPEWCAGRAEAGDLLFLASDAAAARLFDPAARAAAAAAGGAALDSRDPAPLLDWCRAVQNTLNDDVTIMAIRLPAADGTAR